jgi:hypothetical protein
MSKREINTMKFAPRLASCFYFFSGGVFGMCAACCAVFSVPKISKKALFWAGFGRFLFENDPYPHTTGTGIPRHHRLMATRDLPVIDSRARARAGQWDLDPISGDWNTAANWTPTSVPNGPADAATFGLSNTTDVSISANTEVNGIIFTAAATNPYTITASPSVTLTISGAGVTNNSGITQNFVTPTDGFGNSGKIVFSNSATAGTNVAYANARALDTGNPVVGPPQMIFKNNSTAGVARPSPSTTTALELTTMYFFMTTPLLVMPPCLPGIMAI